jgi:hypothetical protein
MMCKLDYVFKDHVAFPGLSCLLIFTIIFLNPFHIFYRKARYEVFRVLYNILISPFGKVRFKTFFLAAIMCSMTKFFQDISFSSCFFYSKHWLNSEVPICPSTNTVNNIIVFFPFYFRFMQCLRRFYENKQNINLLNALKFFMILMI